MSEIQQDEGNSIASNATASATPTISTLIGLQSNVPQVTVVTSSPLVPGGTKRPAPDSQSSAQSDNDEKHTLLYLASVPLPKNWHLMLPLRSMGLDEFGTGHNMQLEYHSGDMFNAPPHTLLIHACNTLGKWGAGIALQFKKRYQEPYEIYRNHCESFPSTKEEAILAGTALLIAPMDDRGHWIGCLFTSRGIGKFKDSNDVILQNTLSAVQHLLELVSKIDAEVWFGRLKNGIGELRMCKINSGKFGVAWSDTEAVITALPRWWPWRESIGVWVQPVDEDKDVVYREQGPSEERPAKRLKPAVTQAEAEAEANA